MSIITTKEIVADLLFGSEIQFIKMSEAEANRRFRNFCVAYVSLIILIGLYCLYYDFKY